ncbi:MAG: VIT1/CCC1 transporter family protein [Candidatus Brennerbacteria bacterium]|nr:VIT1/CCC1 transporter family protein [Candidatus Brennerbacteria bacterium]
MRKENQQHVNGVSSFIRDIVYGANDGIITTFAVVAGVAGASLDSGAVIILGLANLAADGFSMAASNYLGSRSERQLMEKEYLSEEQEVAQMPGQEQKEVRDIFLEHGYNIQDSQIMSELIKKNKPFWLNFMMRYELGFNPDQKNSLRSAYFTFLAFVVAGFLPLAPFIFFPGADIFKVSAVATGLALFMVGALRYLVTGKHWLVSGLEMLFVGGIAASIAYFIGLIISRIV